MEQVIRADQVFDGTALHRDAAVQLGPDGRVVAVHHGADALPRGLPCTDLGGCTLAPGMVDLQVNGGGGAMVGAETNAAQLAGICATHARLGTTAILPTLITDAPEVTRQVLEAGFQAAQRGVPGFAGLHLEGPHLDPARKGAHDASHIRPMTAQDLTMLCDAARKLPALIVTLAPESVSAAQIGTLAQAGVLVSLGHSGCSAEQARAAHQAGAALVTHLYNAMGPLVNRAPGLVGATLTTRLRAGIIADGVHVAPECLAIALQMKAESDLFLVSDAMAAAGTGMRDFTLGGRRILRRDGRLMLEDGTLAGADISLAGAVACLVGLQVPLARALAMATRIPADVTGATDRGRLQPGARGDMVALDAGLGVAAVWVGGQQVA
jgi:N-acetylglucosamine-6-phosphate deacetylase